MLIFSSFYFACEDYEDEEDEDDDDENADNSDSANEDPDKSLEIIENKIHESPMLKSTPSEFSSNPTASALVSLHKANEDLLSLLPDEPIIEDYLDLCFKICSVVEPGDDSAKAAACSYVDDILPKAIKLSSSDAEFNNSFLVSLGLLKGEDKKPLKNIDISGALLVLQHVVKQPYFLKSTSDLLQFFLSRPLTYVTSTEKAKHGLMQILYQM